MRTEGHRRASSWPLFHSCGRRAPLFFFSLIPTSPRLRILRINAEEERLALHSHKFSSGVLQLRAVCCTAGLHSGRACQQLAECIAYGGAGDGGVCAGGAQASRTAVKQRAAWQLAWHRAAEHNHLIRGQPLLGARGTAAACFAGAADAASTAVLWRWPVASALASLAASAACGVASTPGAPHVPTARYRQERAKLAALLSKRVLAVRALPALGVAAEREYLLARGAEAPRRAGLAHAGVGGAARRVLLAGGAVVVAGAARRLRAQVLELVQRAALAAQLGVLVLVLAR